MLQTCQMGVFPNLLYSKLNIRIYDSQADFFHANLARGKRILHRSRKIRLRSWWSKHLHENILLRPVRKTSGKTDSSRFHQTVRKLLRVRSSSWSFNFSDLLLLFDEHVAHRNLCTVNSWPQWYRIDSAKSIQGLQRIEQENAHIPGPGRWICLDILQDIPVELLLCIFQFFNCIRVLEKRRYSRYTGIQSFVFPRSFHGVHAVCLANTSGILDLLCNQFSCYHNFILDSKKHLRVNELRLITLLYILV